MIQLTVLLWSMALLFAYIGFTRGWNKELISTSGIILGLFALTEFDDVVNDLLANIPPEQGYAVRAAIFGSVVFFAYQTRAIIGEDEVRRSRGGEGRDDLQASILGGIVGFINGYLVWGSLWSFMEATNYPLSPYISRPLPGSPSQAFVDNLPLAVLSSGDGNLLAAAVIVLFLVVLIVI